MEQMLGKKDTRKENYYGASTGGATASETTRAFAARMLSPRDKNPYYKGETVIRNLDELDSNIGMFDQGEAAWVADWIEYLGDPTTAVRIRKSPDSFKRIIHERRDELRRIA
jgi:hypothetical protein